MLLSKCILRFLICGLIMFSTSIPTKSQSKVYTNKSSLIGTYIVNPETRNQRTIEIKPDSTFIIEAQNPVRHLYHSTVCCFKWHSDVISRGTWSKSKDHTQIIFNSSYEPGTDKKFSIPTGELFSLDHEYEKVLEYGGDNHEYMLITILSEIEELERKDEVVVLDYLNWDGSVEKKIHYLVMNVNFATMSLIQLTRVLCLALEM